MDTLTRWVSIATIASIVAVIGIYFISYRPNPHVVPLSIPMQKTAPTIPTWFKQLKTPYTFTTPTHKLRSLGIRTMIRTAVADENISTKQIPAKNIKAYYTAFIDPAKKILQPQDAILVFIQHVTVANPKVVHKRNWIKNTDTMTLIDPNNGKIFGYWYHFPKA